MGCPHGLKEIFCTPCKVRAGLVISPAPRMPAPTTASSVHGQNAVSRQEVRDIGYVVLDTSRRNFEAIDSTTTFVHLSGHPFLWIIERVLRLAPKLRTIRVTPAMEPKLQDSHRALWRERGGETLVGRHNAAEWEGTPRSAFYGSQSKFFRDLQGEQKALFEELLALNFVAAEMAARSFCLHGEEFAPQYKVAMEFGYGDEDHHVSERINAVLFYLDPSFKTSVRSQQIAAIIRLRVERLRPLVADAAERARAEARIGRRVPEGLPWSRLPTFEGVLAAVEDGRARALDARHHRVLVERLGLEGSRCRKLREIGADMGITRERVRQLEDDALRQLGITEDV